jgi:hypothetical protein
MIERAMLERVHQHIIEELGQNSRTDTVFVVAAVLINLLLAGINSANNEVGVASISFGLLTLVVNFVALFGLRKGQETRQLLLEGLLKLYRDQKVEGYYPAQLLGNYRTRYGLFTLLVVATGLVAVLMFFG